MKFLSPTFSNYYAYNSIKFNMRKTSVKTFLSQGYPDIFCFLSKVFLAKVTVENLRPTAYWNIMDYFILKTFQTLVILEPCVCFSHLLYCVTSLLPHAKR